MNVKEFLNRFESIKDKNLEIELVNPYKQTGKPIMIDGVCILQVGNKILMDFETEGLIDM